VTRVLVTGANGFVGSALAGALFHGGTPVSGTVRRGDQVGNHDLGVELISIGEVGPDTDWSSALRDIEVIVHLVARTHVMRSYGDDDLRLYRRINVGGTRRLAEQAAQKGVRRFVFVSSIKVNGERTSDRPFRSSDPPSPEDAYGISKREAEEVLADVATRHDMETVVVRPPLVYGPGVRGNFRRLVGLVARGWPLPFGSVGNRRSMIGLDNLVDLLVRCVESPRARGQTFLACDSESLSTPQLIRSIAVATGRPARLFPTPVGVLRMLGGIAGRLEEVGRICDSLEVDARATRELLEWEPAVSVHDGVRETVEHLMRAQLAPRG
jgi:nucleoside-diphosphate-sugar epimerase